MIETAGQSLRSPRHLLNGPEVVYGLLGGVCSPAGNTDGVSALAATTPFHHMGIAECKGRQKGTDNFQSNYI